MRLNRETQKNFKKISSHRNDDWSRCLDVVSEQNTQSVKGFLFSVIHSTLVVIAHDGSNISLGFTFHNQFTDTATFGVEFLQLLIQGAEQFTILHDGLCVWGVILQVIRPTLLVTLAVLNGVIQREVISCGSEFTGKAVAIAHPGLGLGTHTLTVCLGFLHFYP